MNYKGERLSEENEKEDRYEYICEHPDYPKWVKKREKKDETDR